MPCSLKLDLETYQAYVVDTLEQETKLVILDPKIEDESFLNEQIDLLSDLVNERLDSDEPLPKITDALASCIILPDLSSNLQKEKIIISTDEKEKKIKISVKGNLNFDFVNCHQSLIYSKKTNVTEIKENFYFGLMEFDEHSKKFEIVFVSPASTFSS